MQELTTAYVQNFNPLENIFISAFIAFLPILCFLSCLLLFKIKAHLAAFVTVILASALAVFAYGMPFALVGASFVQGFINGLWPIAWIIIAAIFLYKLSVKTGSFEIIRQSVISITPDHRIQVILIGFCFGSFLEGAIGFGGPVAITAALLVGLGLRPLYAAGLCLIANTAPVAFGAVGIPIIAMSNLVGVQQLEISAMTGRMLFPLSIIVPFFLVFLMDGFKGLKETFPAIFVAAFSFALTQLYSSNYLGAELPDILSAVVSLLCTTIFLKFYSPKNIFRLDDEKDFSTENKLSAFVIFKAWLPFLLLIICIIIWTQPWFKSLFDKGGIFAYTQVKLSFSNLQGLILDPNFKPVDLGLPIHFVGFQAGTAILLAALLSILFLRIRLEEVSTSFWETLKEMFIPCITIGLVVSFAFISKNSGMSTTLGLAFAQSGQAFAFFSPVIGWIGVFLTGSDTSSNLLFATLQQVSARELGIKEALFLAANSVGGVVGKMISPQSIAIACAAVGLVGRESELLKFTLKYSVGFIVLISILTAIIAFFMQGIIPDVVPLQR